MKIIHCTCSVDKNGFPLNSLSGLTDNAYKLYNNTEDISLVIYEADTHWKSSDNELSSYMLDVIKSTTFCDYNRAICIDSISKEHNVDEKTHAFMIKYLQPLFCNELKPEIKNTLNHFLQQQPLWDDYKKINRAYAKAVAEVYKQGDMIWIHDYQLLMMPHYLREIFPDCNIGLSVSTKFPYWEHLSNIYGHKELLQSMLQADRIWFQTKLDSRHFATACVRFLSLSSPPTSKQIDVLSMSTRSSTLNSEYTTERYHYFKDMFANKRIIYCRNTNIADVVKTLAAFAEIVSRNEYLRDQLVLLQFCSSEIPASELKEVADIARQINCIYGSSDFVPVHFYHQDLDQEEEKALMMAAELGVFLGSDATTEEASKKFILCQHNHNSPIIVSETSTLNILHGAFTVDNNPTNIPALVECLQSVFTMGRLSAVQRYKTLYQHIVKSEATMYAKSSIKDLATRTASKSYTRSSSDDTVYSIIDSPDRTLTSSPEPMYSSKSSPEPTLTGSPELIFSTVSSPEIPYLTKSLQEPVYSQKSPIEPAAFPINSEKLLSKEISNTCISSKTPLSKTSPWPTNQYARLNKDHMSHFLLAVNYPSMAIKNQDTCLQVLKNTHKQRTSSNTNMKIFISMLLSQNHSQKSIIFPHIKLVYKLLHLYFLEHQNLQQFLHIA